MKAFQLIFTSFLVATIWADLQYVLVARIDNFFYGLKSIPFGLTSRRMLLYDTRDQLLRNKESVVSRENYIFMKWEKHYRPLFFFNKVLSTGQTRNPFEFKFDSKKKITNVDFYACERQSGGSEYYVGQEPDVEGSVCDTVDIYFLPLQKRIEEPALPGEEEEIQPNFKPVLNEWKKDVDKYFVSDNSEPVHQSNLLNDIVRD